MSRLTRSVRFSGTRSQVAWTDRIGWIVPAIDPDGRRRNLMVTGASVFELRRATTGGEPQVDETGGGQN